MPARLDDRFAATHVAMADPDRSTLSPLSALCFGPYGLGAPAIQIARVSGPLGGHHSLCNQVAKAEQGGDNGQGGGAGISRLAP
jgi:hypothetical protein